MGSRPALLAATDRGGPDVSGRGRCLCDARARRRRLRAAPGFGHRRARDGWRRHADGGWWHTRGRQGRDSRRHREADCRHWNADGQHRSADRGQRLFGACWSDHLSGAIPSAEHRRAHEQHPDVRPDAASHDQPMRSSGVNLHRESHDHAKTPESSVVDWPLAGKLHSFALPMPRGIERLTAFEIGYRQSLP